MLGKGRFSNDVPLCLHYISLQFNQLYDAIHVHVDLNLRGL